MLNHLFLKFGLFFIGGAVCTYAAVHFLSSKEVSIANRGGNNPTQVLGDQSPSLDEKLHEAGQEGAKKVVQAVVDKVVSHLRNNPAFDPVVKTTEDVQSTVDEVRSLPQDQKAAICAEICAPAKRTH